MAWKEPNDYIVAHWRKLVTRSADYYFMPIKLYKLGVDGILCKCVMEHEHGIVLYEVHEDIVGGHNVGKSITQQVLCIGLWWTSLFV